MVPILVANVSPFLGLDLTVKLRFNYNWIINLLVTNSIDNGQFNDQLLTFTTVAQIYCYNR